MNILVDMNLPPAWCEILERQGWNSVHWSTVGEVGAPDEVLFDWARQNKYVVFTHDLDFGSILAATNAESPSVFQVRTQDVIPASIENLVVSAFHRFQSDLEAGAIVVINESRQRARVLPLKRENQ